MVLIAHGAPRHAPAGLRFVTQKHYLYQPCRIERLEVALVSYNLTGLPIKNTLPFQFVEEWPGQRRV
jgi:hypothetical protein